MSPPYLYTQPSRSQRLQTLKGEQYENIIDLGWKVNERRTEVPTRGIPSMLTFAHLPFLLLSWSWTSCYLTWPWPWGRQQSEEREGQSQPLMSVMGASSKGRDAKVRKDDSVSDVIAVASNEASESRSYSKLYPHDEVITCIRSHSSHECSS